MSSPSRGSRSPRRARRHDSPGLKSPCGPTSPAEAVGKPTPAKAVSEKLSGDCPGQVERQGKCQNQKGVAGNEERHHAQFEKIQPCEGGRKDEEDDDGVAEGERHDRRQDRFLQVSCFYSAEGAGHREDEEDPNE